MLTCELPHEYILFNAYNNQWSSHASESLKISKKNSIAPKLLLRR